MNNENKKSTKKLSGFYIALCCCVLMIGIAGYFTEKRTENSETVMNNEFSETAEEPVFSGDFVNDTDSISVTEPPAAAEETATNEEEASTAEEAAETESYAVDNPDLDGEAITVSSDQPAFIMPLSGDVLEQYSDILRYNNSLGDWRTHSGIDLAADKGCSVASVAQGVVERVYDNAMGTCVEISHAGGFVTRYMGLESAENLSEGQEVQSGEVIGTVGDCRGENVTQPHLHFEMDKDKVAVNPSDFLPHD